MTDKPNEKSKEFDNSVNAPSDNPLEELAKIIGYQDDGQVDNSKDGSANEAVTDLEAELLREFGVEPQTVTHVSPEVSTPMTEVAAPSVTSSQASEIDDVLDDMSRYELPSHDQSANAAPTRDLTPDFVAQNNVAPVQADLGAPVEPPVVAPSPTPVEPIPTPVVPAPEISTIETSTIETSTMSRATPVLPPIVAETSQEILQETSQEVPQSPEIFDPFNSMQPEPEVADLPNPLSTPSPFASENEVKPEHNSDQSSFDIGQMSSDLEQELEKLQHGLEAGVNEVPETVIAPAAPETPFEPVVTEPVQSPVFQQEPSFSEPQAERPFPSVVMPQNATTPPDFSEMVATEEVVERTEDLENVLDVSGFTETEADIEETAPFEIPELPKVEEFSREQSNIDVDLDLELEREFSQLISGDLSPEQDVHATAAPITSAETVEASTSFGVSETGNNNADMDELNELFNVGVAEPSADVAPQVNHGPDRIDVTQDADNYEQDVVAEDETSGSSSNTIAVVGVLAALLLGGGAYLYLQNSGASLGGSNEPVIIKADNSPIKEVPADPGGASVPNQDQAVYDQVEGNDVSVANQSSLVESTEEPVDIVQRTLNPSILPLEGRDLVADDKNADRLAPNDDAALANSLSDATQPLVTPRRVQTVIVQSDGTIITREAPAPEPTPEPVVAAPAAPTPAPTQAPTVTEQPVETALAQETPAPVAAPAAPVATVAPVVQPEETAPLSNDTAAAIANAPVQAAPEFSGYYMQIASQPSLASAESSYANLSSRFNSLLGGLPVEYQTANIEGKGTFHRVRIQVGSRAEANSLCSRYKSAGGSCFVAR